jgi:hypothetical protein
MTSRYDQQKWREHDGSPSTWNNFPGNRRHPLMEEWKGQEKNMGVELDKPVSDTEEKKRSDEGQLGQPAAALSQNLDEVLSDISDDANDILNQDDELAAENDSQLSGNTTVKYPEQPITQQVTTDVFLDRRPLFECLTERSLDFEEISDEELEEEARLNKGN